MTNSPDATTGLSFLLYRSNAAPWLTNDDMRAILASARDRNRDLSLTGCLHHEAGLFFQWLEGPAPAVQEVLALLRRDRRHSALNILSSGPLEHRLFRNWTMRYSDRDQMSLMDWFAGSDSSTVNPQDYVRSVVSFLRMLPG
ncbi:BLUF domain-containing protein [Paracoccus bogoriensis]|uniref:BLUF domain-containing protein n=1 Tax=Paracoccus bogoriensis TaxID=242065 RepID=UPI001C68570E|nr:BLUF domain-containing protein [Paracoccus bogoriensis]MBW7057145.1 BLUF domain-containing protein [Paracoccus bogoriensis]